MLSIQRRTVQPRGQSFGMSGNSCVCLGQQFFEAIVSRRRGGDRMSSHQRQVGKEVDHVSILPRKTPALGGGVRWFIRGGAKRVLVQSALLKASETLFQSTTSHHAVR